MSKLIFNPEKNMKELEKYGFQESYWGYAYYPNNNSPNTKYFSCMKIHSDKIVVFDLTNMSSWCNSLEELDDDINNIQKSYESIKKKCTELKEANLIIDEEELKDGNKCV